MITLRLRLFRLSLPVALCVLVATPAQATDSAENLQKMYEAEQAKLKAKPKPHARQRAEEEESGVSGGGGSVQQSKTVPIPGKDIERMPTSRPAKNSPSANSVLVKLNKAVAIPDRIAPGQTVTVVSDYSLVLPGSQANVNVSESYTLKKDGKVLFTPPPQKAQHSPGGYQVIGSFNMPKDAEAGIYVVEVKVEAGTSYDVSQAVFVVTEPSTYP